MFKDWFNSLGESTKRAIDAVSFTTAWASMLDALPHIATLMSIVWFAIRVYETRTVQRWLGRDVPEAKADD